MGAWVATDLHSGAEPSRIAAPATCTTGNRGRRDGAAQFFVTRPFIGPWSRDHDPYSAGARRALLFARRRTLRALLVAGLAGVREGGALAGQVHLARMNALEVELAASRNIDEWELYHLQSPLGLLRWVQRPRVLH